MNFPLTFCRHVFIEETTYKTTHNNSTTFVVLLLLGNEHEVSLGNFRYQTMMAVVYFLVFPLLDRKIFLLSLTRCEKQAKTNTLGLVTGWGVLSIDLHIVSNVIFLNFRPYYQNKAIQF